MTSYKKLEKIAEACNVDVQTVSEDGRLVTQLWGHSKAIKEVLKQIEGYSERWLGHEFDEAPDDEPDARVNLYSGKVRWDLLGY